MGLPRCKNVFCIARCILKMHGIPRDELIEHFIDEKLVDVMKSKKSQFDEGHVILNRLENICLLERVERYECVKMHDLVRDMAISVTRVGPPRFLVKAGMKLEAIPNEETWSEDLVRVSLMENNIKSIPFSSSPPKCPTLLTLLLCDNISLRVIPTLFFMHMISLTVLDLSNTSIKSLPSSISNLESLTALLLQSCRELRFVPSLENLTALRRLDLAGSAIEEVPKGLEKLINLRYLSFEDCADLLTMPDGILSKLSQIEYLKSSQKVTLRVKEIGSWKILETFYGKFEDITEFNSCIRLWNEREPEEYGIVGGNWYDDAFSNDFEHKRRHVILTEAKGSEDTLVLPRRIDFLGLFECHGITSLGHDNFSTLRILEIIGCRRLERVFTSTVLSNLQSLVRCEVHDCIELVEIIGETSDEDENRESTTAVMTVLPRLQSLVLTCLPELKSFCNSSIKVSDSLKSIKIKCCPELMRITLLWEEPHPHPSLELIDVEKEWWDTVEWKHPKTKDFLQPYVKFISP